MNKYESIIIISQNVEEEGIKSLITRFTDLINTDGKVLNVNEVGLKNLLMRLGKIKKAIMYYLNLRQNQN